MIEIDLTKYHHLLKFKKESEKRFIFDPVRKNYFVLQPEEMVRQVWIQYLLEVHNVALSAMSVEKQFEILNLKKRIDLMVYNKGIPYVLFEFKSFNTVINEDVAFQVSTYNLKFKVPYLIISNGVVSYAYLLSAEKESYVKLNSIDFLS